MKLPKFTFETGLYILAVLVAGFIRFVALGAETLTHSEADLALQVLGITRGESNLVLGPHPLYLALTSLLMSVLGDSNFTARFWPALAGSLLVLAPVLFRHRLGKFPAVLLAFFLAVDPGLAAVSRQAGSTALALTCFWLAFGFWDRRNPLAAGVFAGLAVLGGPEVWRALLGLGLAGWAMASLLREPAAEQPASEDGDPQPHWKEHLRTAALFAAATILFAGSAFFWIPGGWSAAAASLPAYLQTWFEPSGVVVVHLLQALIFYSFLAVLGGMAGAVLHWENQVVRFLSVWVVFALLLALVPAGRQVSGLVWALVPLWGLTAYAAAHIFYSPLSERLPTLGQALLCLVILVFLIISVVGVAEDTLLGRQQAGDWLGLAAALLLLVLTTGLVAWGWSGRIAGYGLVWGIAAVLFLFTLHSTWNSTGLEGRHPAELWAAGPTIRDGDLIQKTIQELSLWNGGMPDRRKLAVLASPSPALQWILRNQNQVQYGSSLVSSSSPDFVITDEQEELALSAAYRGQDFVFEEKPVWQVTGWPGWVRWLVFREVGVETRSIVFWARADLFPGGEVQAQESPEWQSPDNQGDSRE